MGIRARAKGAAEGLRKPMGAVCAPGAAARGAERARGPGAAHLHARDRSPDVAAKSSGYLIIIVIISRSPSPLGTHLKFKSGKAMLRTKSYLSPRRLSHFYPPIPVLEVGGTGVSLSSINATTQYIPKASVRYIWRGRANRLADIGYMLLL